MPTIGQIKTEYGEMQAAIINQSFALGASAQHMESEMSPELQQRLGPQDFERARAAEAAAWADEERDRLRSRYEELDLQKRAAIEVRVEEVERELSRKTRTSGTSRLRLRPRPKHSSPLWIWRSPPVTKTPRWSLSRLQDSVTWRRSSPTPSR